VATISPSCYPGDLVLAGNPFTALTDPWTVSGGVSGYEATPADIAKFAVTPQTGPVNWTIGKSGSTKYQLVKEVTITATASGGALSLTDPGTVALSGDPSVAVSFHTGPTDDDGTYWWHIQTTPKVDGTAGNTTTNGLGSLGGGTANQLTFTTAGSYRVDIVVDTASGTYSGWFNLTVGS
jgi:hypothetical protein